MSRFTPLKLTLEFHTETRRSVRAFTSRLLADDEIRDQLALNGEPNRQNDRSLYRKHTIDLSFLQEKGVPDETNAVVCEFLRTLAEYLFNHHTNPRDACKNWHRTNSGYALKHGDRTLHVTLSRGELVMNLERTRISINNPLSEPQTRRLFECLSQHYTEMTALIEAVANATPDPHDEAVKQGLLRYEQTGDAGYAEH